MSKRSVKPTGLLSGDDFLGMFISAQACIAMHSAQIDALNVFPVPDGDTGANMVLTLKAVEPKLVQLRGQSVGDIASAIAHETMMGARGNSGVILSQLFLGIANDMEHCDTFSGRGLANALERAAVQAYKGVSKPVEGTMLTVVRLAAEAAQRAVAEGRETPREIWDAACQAAREALAQTPELLPVLKEAGVVDAGGLGIVAMMEGARAYLKGQKPALLDFPIGNAAPRASYLAATAKEAFGYCTQFLLQGQGLDVEAARRRIEAMSASTIVVGGQAAIMVHAHAHDPGPLLSYAISLGSLSQVKIENMDRQHQGFMAIHTEQAHGEAAAVGVVAVAIGQGLERIFQEHGACAIVPGGQTMNPSARDLLNAVESANAREVILLPNNANIIPAAKQAAALSQRPIHVLPAVSIPQGIAALLAFAPDADAVTNLVRMEEALRRVRSGEVTRAVRNATLAGVAVREGQAIALLDGELVAASGSPTEALEALCAKASLASGALLTLYWGGAATEAQAQEAAQRLRTRFAEVDVEVVYGGQPYYDFIVGME